MKSVYLGWIGLLFLFVSSASAGSPRTLVGVVRDQAGEFIGDIAIHANAEDNQSSLETRTLEDGSFSIEVPDGELRWTIAVDERELLERGYFCLPDFEWEPGDSGIIPILTAVPLRPTMDLTRTADGIVGLQLSFDWMDGLQPAVLRQYRVERTTDMVNWKEVVTVALACPPMVVFDETIQDESQCVYRTVAADAVVFVLLEPGDFRFIADPALGWEGPPIVTIDPSEPLPSTPVVAPEIRVIAATVDP